MTPEQALQAALRSCPNHPYMVLPGPVEITGSFVKSAMQWFAENGWVLTSVPKDSVGRDLEMFWRIKPGLWCQDCQTDYEQGSVHRCAG